MGYGKRSDGRKEMNKVRLFYAKKYQLKEFGKWIAIL